MSSNKFKTIIHKNPNKITSILLYALLEWILIFLLLANGLFSYIISKFAEFFGLAKPCVFCARVDNLFESDDGQGTSIRRIVCDEHAAEISKLGYCSAHGRIGDASDMCEDCSQSKTEALSWMKRSEEGEKDIKCSCCGVSLESGFFSPFFELKDLKWGGFEVGEVLERDCSDEKVGIGVQVGEEVEDVDDEFSEFVCCLSEDVCLEFVDRGVEGVCEEERLVSVELIDDATMKMVPVVHFQEPESEFGSTAVEENGRDLNLENTIVSIQGEVTEHNGCITENKLLDSISGIADENSYGGDEIENGSAVLDVGGSLEDNKSLEFTAERTDVGIVNSSEVGEPKKVETVVDVACVSEERIGLPSSWGSSDTVNMVSADNDVEQVIVGQEDLINLDEKGVDSIAEVADDAGNGCSVLADTELVGDGSTSCQFDVPPLETRNVVPEVEALIADEDPETPDTTDENLIDVEMTRDVSIGSHICDQEHISLAHSRRPILLPDSAEEQQTESNSLMDAWMDQATETEITLVNDQNTDNVFAYTPQINEIEEERSPMTPTYRDCVQGLNKNIIFGRRDSTTESLDGSIAGDFEGFDTMEQLKTALNAERKALSALYADLEEERCASAIAANQTMAMITRLQEEKAAMQMEALQYQRMMEEQSEYDQEALHLLNELLMKREKEKHDLEKELEFYRKKNLLDEAERRKHHKANERGGTPASSTAADSDDLSSEFREGDDDAGYFLDESYQNSQRDTLVTAETEEDNTTHLITLDESFLDFEDERLSILEQLRTLEERLIPTEDEDTDNLEDLKHFAGENGYLPNGNHEYLKDGFHVLEDSPNDHNANGKLEHEQTRKSFKGKRLLPLFEAISDENEDKVGTNGDLCSVSPQTKDNLAIIEEFENLHDRLQALEADREFLKYCLGSLKKGERGTCLLEEILEHLRELRSAELRARSKSEAIASLSA